MASFPDVRLISNGENVDQQTTNRGFNDLTERTNFLKDQIDGLLFVSERLLAVNQDVDDSVLDSQIVYLDEVVGKWKPAIAEFDFVPNSTEVSLKNSGFIQGLAKNITGIAGSKKAEVFLYGLINGVNPVNLLESGSPSTNVPYFLSTSSGGKITETKPSILEVFCGKFISSTRFLFTPDISVNSAQHVHRAFLLDGTKFVHLGGDNFLYPAAEFSAFPPIPASLAVLYVNGIQYIHGIHFTIDVDGLHYDHVLAEENPPDADPDVFLAMLFFVDIPSLGEGVVTSLFSDTDNVSLVSCETGEEANSGNLKISVVPVIDLLIDQSGKDVIKNIQVDQDSGNLLVKKGPVVEKIISGQGIQVDQNQGIVTVSSTAAIGDGTSVLGEVSLINAREKFVPNTPETFVEFSKNVDAKIAVRASLDSSEPKDLEFILFYFGSVNDGSQVTLEVQYRINKIGFSVSGGLIVKTVSIDISNLYSRSTLFTIPKSELSKEASVSFFLKRSSSDIYTGNFNLLDIKRK